MAITPPYSTLKKMNEEATSPKIAVLGLGYVGLPLACMFATRYKVTGLDINSKRVNEINRGIDSNSEVYDDTLRLAVDGNLRCTSNPDEIADCNVYIVTVPTPVDADNRPDLEPLREASAKIGAVIKPGDTVIYESTVYPGATEEVCVPIIEQVSGLKLNVDFHAGYSPERVNPGDWRRPVNTICKITSGSSPEAAEFVDSLYSSVLHAPTYRASSIKTAEAAKILENTQRDVNIALMNEAARIFDALGIDTRDVIEAAATKWNFQPLHPGLVGGHCISVDPYYLIDKAHTHGVTPTLMEEARKINSGMHLYVADRAERLLAERGRDIDRARILLLGFTFKENCRDTRNTKVADLYRELTGRGAETDVYDPNVDSAHAMTRHGVPVMSTPGELDEKKYDLIVYCVNHSAFSDFDIKGHLLDNGAVFDLKSGLPKSLSDSRL